MSVDRRSRRLIVRLHLYPLLATVAILLTLAFAAGVLARPLVIPDKSHEEEGWVGNPTPTPIHTPTPTPFGPPPAAPVPPPTATPFVAPREPYVLLLVSSTPLRAGPGVHYHTFAQGMRYQGYFLLGISEDTLWYAVQLPGVPGNMAWVESRLTIAYNATRLPVMPAYNPAPPIDPYPTPGKAHLLVMVESAIREGPGVAYLPIRTVAPGEWFRLAGSSPDGLWLAISLDGVSSDLGWLRADAASLY